MMLPDPDNVSVLLFISYFCPSQKQFCFSWRPSGSQEHFESGTLSLILLKYGHYFEYITNSGLVRQPYSSSVPSPPINCSKIPAQNLHKNAAIAKGSSVDCSDVNLKYIH